jgi:hypothetical protein
MKNKTYKLLLLAFLFSFIYYSTLSAQKFELVPSAGYETSAKIKSVKGTFRINDGMDFGGSASYKLSRGYKFEISYSHLATNLSLTDSVGVTSRVCDMAVTHFSFGGVVEINPEDMVVPFGMIGLGGTYYNPLKSEIDKESVMHFNFSGGAKFMFSSHFGLRIQAGLYLPIFFQGMVFEEAAPGPGEGVKSEIAGVQGDFTAGVIFRF